jgi:hypothetical protein
MVGHPCTRLLHFSSTTNKPSEAMGSLWPPSGPRKRFCLDDRISPTDWSRNQSGERSDPDQLPLPILQVDLSNGDNFANIATSDEAIAALDESFFRVRFNRLTPAEKKYLRAMAELGPGPHRSGDIADQMRRTVNSLAPTRANLIAKGMIWSPTHADTAFTVPLFDESMKRIMPGEQCRNVDKGE